MKTLIIAEHNHSNLNDSNKHVICAAQQLGADIELLIIGTDISNLASIASNFESIKQVITADNICYQHQLAENCAELIASIAQEYSYILTPATTFGKDLLPRVAALLDVEQVSDVVQIIDAETFMHPIYAGNAIETVKNTAPIKLLTIRTTAFAACQQSTKPCAISNVTDCFESKNTRFLKLDSTPMNSRPDLSMAKVVVAGGRGLQSKDNFKLLEDLALELNAAIGASRAAVDAGFVPNDYQIGQTGKIVAPELYIAIGISGAIQHLAGMKDSKVIVAINKDPEAPIFKVADYGIVGDLFEIVPELIASLKQ